MSEVEPIAVSACGSNKVSMYLLVLSMQHVCILSSPH